MAENQVVTVELEDGLKLAVAVDAQRGGMVADKDIVGKLEEVTSAIERVGRDVLESVKKVSPSSATVVLNFGIALSQGQLIALFGKASGQASITVTLEWSKGS